MKQISEFEDFEIEKIKEKLSYFDGTYEKELYSIEIASSYTHERQIHFEDYEKELSEKLFSVSKEFYEELLSDISFAKSYSKAISKEEV